METNRFADDEIIQKAMNSSTHISGVTEETPFSRREVMILAKLPNSHGGSIVNVLDSMSLKALSQFKEALDFSELHGEVYALVPVDHNLTKAQNENIAKKIVGEITTLGQEARNLEYALEVRDNLFEMIQSEKFQSQQDIDALHKDLTLVLECISKKGKWRVALNKLGRVKLLKR